MSENLVEDGKVIGSASIAVLIDYAQIFNQIITLLISLCTLIYVANRAYNSLFTYKKNKKRKKGKHKC